MLSSSKAKVYTGKLTTTLRGQKLEVRYVKNRRQLSRNQDLVIVLPGLDKPAFEDQVFELGQLGLQALSLDFTNINKVGPLEAPTAEEDAQILHDLLAYLKLTRKNYKGNIYFMNHSRGTLVAARFFGTYSKKFRISGMIHFNPYVGWIPTYQEALNAKQLSQPLRVAQGMMTFVPGVSQVLQGMIDWTEHAGKMAARSALHLYFNIHNKESAHSALRSVMGDVEPEKLENIRQKLIGMENAEIGEDFMKIQESRVPAIIVRASHDEFVPAGMVDMVSK
ncbi:MAG: hypothetical protein KDD34_00880, partial [Bdellovibrionales bacterium]|nr:hypothetical protein [Bdellovibrionales bacterium]